VPSRRHAGEGVCGGRVGLVRELPPPRDTGRLCGRRRTPLLPPGLGLGRPSRFRLGVSSVAGAAAGGAVLLRDGEGRMCGAEIAFCQLPHILLICTGLWRGPSRLTGGSRCPRPSAACPRCSLCRAGTGWVGEAGDCGRWGGEGFVLTLAVCLLCCSQRCTTTRTSCTSTRRR